MNKITEVTTVDVRFPTSKTLSGSDAVNREPDYSAAYIKITTEQGDCGYALIFTIGRGNDLCCAAVEAMKYLVLDWELADIQEDVNRFYQHLKSDSQLRWLGPEKGVIHMAMGGIMNAVWDLWARYEQKPLWRLLADMPAEQFVACLDLTYISDALSRDEAYEIVSGNQSEKEKRIEELNKIGYPAYTTSAGWLGYSDDKMAELSKEAVLTGFQYVKLKVGFNIDDDTRRCRIVRGMIGDKIKLLIDANQIWEVGQAIHWLKALAPFNPWFIEEPTHADDIFGHRQIKQAIAPIMVATGEHCHNRVMFKQLIVNDAIDVVQIDACRQASLNEILSIYVMSEKYNKLVFPHAGGIGLCEYVQHLSMIDYVQISGKMEDRAIEYVEHLHEHFVDPCCVTGGRYTAPNKPGFSIKMLEESVDTYRYPDGKEWQQYFR